MLAVEKKLITQATENVETIIDEVGTLLPYMQRYILDSKTKRDGLVLMYHVVGVPGIRWIHGHHTYFFESLCYEMGRVFSTACNYHDNGGRESVSLLGSLLATVVLLEWKDIALDDNGVLKENTALGLIKSLTKPLTDNKELMSAVSAELRYLYRVYCRDGVFSCGQDRVVVKMVMKKNQPLFLIKS